MHPASRYVRGGAHARPLGRVGELCGAIFVSPSLAARAIGAADVEESGQLRAQGKGKNRSRPNCSSVGPVRVAWHPFIAFPRPLKRSSLLPNKIIRPDWGNSGQESRRSGDALALAAAGARGGSSGAKCCRGNGALSPLPAAICFFPYVAWLAVFARHLNCLGVRR